MALSRLMVEGRTTTAIYLFSDSLCSVSGQRMLRTASMTSVFAAPGDPSTVANGVVRNLSLAEGTNDTTCQPWCRSGPQVPRHPVDSSVTRWCPLASRVPHVRGATTRIRRSLRRAPVVGQDAGDPVLSSLLAASATALPPIGLSGLSGCGVYIPRSPAEMPRGLAING